MRSALMTDWWPAGHGDLGFPSCREAARSTCEAARICAWAIPLGGIRPVLLLAGAILNGSQE